MALRVKPLARVNYNSTTRPSRYIRIMILTNLTLAILILSLELNYVYNCDGYSIVKLWRKENFDGVLS